MTALTRLGLNGTPRHDYGVFTAKPPFDPFTVKNVDIMPGWDNSAISLIGSTGSTDISPGWDNAARIKENFPC